jgi:DNA-directed RNA polymerase subunit beta'
MPNLNPIESHKLMVQRAKEAIASHFPIEGSKHRLELVRVELEEDSATGASQFNSGNYESQMDARLNDRTWGPDIIGVFRLVDKASGKVLDEKSRTLGKIPKITTRYSYIVNGNEMQLDSVFRLNPGAYHAEAQNGDLLAKWNVAAGSRVGSFDIYIERRDPKKLGLMTMDVSSSGTSSVQIPIYPILKAMGIDDGQIKNALGEKIYVINRDKSSATDVLKFHKALEGRKKDADYAPPSTADAAKFTREVFESAEVSPQTMKAAFGKEFDRITGEALLLSAKKLVDISRGDVPEDDRQSLANKRLYGAEDFVYEELTKGKTIYALTRKIRNNVDRKDKVQDIIPASNAGYGAAILKPFKAGQLPTQTNPLQFVSNHTKTTILGAEFGGIKGENVNLMEDKLINPSHLGLLDPLQTPESSTTGIHLHVPLGAKKVGHDLMAQVVNVRTGKVESKSAADLERAVVAYPDQVKIDKKPDGSVKVTPLSADVVVYDKDRNTTKRPWKDVEYVLPSAKLLFAVSANLIPFVQNDNGNRAMMAAKHQEQAVGLKQREAPLVQTQAGGGTSYESLVGNMAVVSASADGTVTEITESRIVVTGDDKKKYVHSIYNNYPLNGAKHMLHSEPVVKKGDRVRKGQLLADSNFTKGGKLSLGTNLRVAYIPYRGYNFEDGVVISESAAQKLVSSHLHSAEAEMHPNVVVNKKMWRQYAGPVKATPEILQKLDDDGVIRVGQRVEPGDVLIAKLQKQSLSKDTEDIRRRLKGAVQDYTDSGVRWEHEYSGEVARVVNNGRKIAVFIRTEQTMEVGDKLSGRHGNKGIVTKILPDDKMPKDKDGNPVHVLMSPAGIPSRMNPGQVLETVAGKIALKTGKPFVVDNFSADTDYSALVKAEMKKNNVSDTDELFDPETGESLGQVLTGQQYILKLDHQAEKKISARSGGFGYAYKTTGEASQGSGLGEGGQRIGGLDTYTLLAHGAKQNLREMQTYKSDREQAEDVWTRIMRGERPPPPKVPRSMEQFTYYMRAMGVYSERKGREYSLMPMTDKQTVAQSSGALAFPEKTLAAKGSLTKEERGGLFDRIKTGGLEGTKWTHMELGVRIPNPMFEEPIRLLLQMPKPEFQKLLTESGAVGKKSGFAVIEQRLREIDVDRELKVSEKRLSEVSENELNVAYKRVRYLRALKELGVKPVDAYTNKVLPVLPPSLRRVSIGFDGTQIIDPANKMYAIIGQMVKQLEQAEKEKMPVGEIQKIQAQIYETTKALRVSGMQMEGKQVPSLMDKLTGLKQPKQSFFQSGVLGKRQDLSGRSVITPDPEMPLDEVGVPREMAMEMYKPFVIKELWRNMGRANSPGEARLMIKKNHPAANEALERVVRDRPALMKRDPALHMFSILAFRPRLVEGKSVKIHPLVTGGFNADFDGDTMALYVPITDGAVQEAKNMLPSKNLFSPTSGGLMVTPSQDSVLGIFQATEWGKPVSGQYTEEEAVRLLKAGKLKSYNVINVKGYSKPTTAGRLMINATLPAQFKGDQDLLYDPNFRMAKGGMKRFATRVARAEPEEFSRMIDDWKTLGFGLAFKNGSSVKLDDFHDGYKLRDEVLKKYKKEEDAIRKGSGSIKDKDDKIVALYQKAQKELKQVGEARYNSTLNNGMWDWARSGAKGDWNQFGQMVMGPMLVQDPMNQTVPFPITKSFGEGLPVSQYYASLHGARKGTIDRASATAKPGALTKELINTVIDNTIKSKDCGTIRGALLSSMESDIEGRFLAGEVPLKGGETVAKGTLITPQIRSKIKTDGPKKILVRSPLYCNEVKGICATCYGLSERGSLYTVGTNVGIIAGHALGEPITQMQMRTFHTGGVGGTSGVGDYFTAAEDLFKVPKKLKGSATLSTVSGKIEKIENDALGGKIVTIAGKPHVVPFTNPLLPSIRVGEEVEKADALSEGRKNPHDILTVTKNMSAVRTHLADSLNELYAETTGNERRRNIETVIRAMTDLTRIDDPGDDHMYLRGQLVPMSEIERKNKELRAMNKREVKHTPQLKAMNKMPLAGQEDWMARLNFQRLQETYVEGAAQNWKSDIHGHPIAGIAHGAEFGLEPPGSVKVPNAPGITERISNVPKTPPPGKPSSTLKSEKKPGFFSFI